MNTMKTTKQTPKSNLVHQWQEQADGTFAKVLIEDARLARCTEDLQKVKTHEEFEKVITFWYGPETIQELREIGVNNAEQAREAMKGF